MFIGKLLLDAVFDPLLCLDKIMDGLLLSGIVDESRLSPRCSLWKYLSPSQSVLKWIQLSVSQAQWQVCRMMRKLCARRFSVTLFQACFKNGSHYCLQAFSLSFSLRTNHLLHFKSSCWHSTLDLHTELFFTTWNMNWVLRSVVCDSPGSRESLVGAAWEAEGRRSRDSPARGKTTCCDCQGSACVSALFLLFGPCPFPVAEAVRALQVLGRAVERSGNAAGNVPSGVFSWMPFAWVQCCRVWALDPWNSSQKPKN